MALLRVRAIVALLAWSATQAFAAPPTEYQVKAVFLYNFAQFIEWPAAAFPSEGTPFVIGVLGDDPFGVELDAVVRGESVAGHPLLVRRYRQASEVESCHILYISDSEAARLGQILKAFKGRSVLTVGDTEDFAISGGMIHFVTESNRIRLRIRLGAALAEQLTISSKLLRLAEIVPGGGNE
jgi:hypothetical protein